MLHWLPFYVSAAQDHVMPSVAIPTCCCHTHTSPRARRPLTDAPRPGGPTHPTLLNAGHQPLTSTLRVALLDVKVTSFRKGMPMFPTAVITSSTHHTAPHQLACDRWRGSVCDATLPYGCTALQAQALQYDYPRAPGLRVSTITPASIDTLRAAGAWQALAPPRSAEFTHMQASRRGRWPHAGARHSMHAPYCAG